MAAQVGKRQSLSGSRCTHSPPIHVHWSTYKSEVAQVLEVLTKRFGIDLSSLGDIEARVSEVLES